MTLECTKCRGSSENLSRAHSHFLTITTGQPRPHLSVQREARLRRGPGLACETPNTTRNLKYLRSTFSNISMLVCFPYIDVQLKCVCVAYTQFDYITVYMYLYILAMDSFIYLSYGFFLENLFKELWLLKIRSGSSPDLLWSVVQLPSSNPVTLTVATYSAERLFTFKP